MHKMIAMIVIAIAAASFIAACNREQPAPPAQSAASIDKGKGQDQKKSEPDAAAAPADPMKNGY